MWMENQLGLSFLSQARTRRAKRNCSWRVNLKQVGTSALSLAEAPAQHPWYGVNRQENMRVCGETRPFMRGILSSYFAGMDPGRSFTLGMAKRLRKFRCPTRKRP